MKYDDLRARYEYRIVYSAKTGKRHRQTGSGNRAGQSHRDSADRLLRNPTRSAASGATAKAAIFAVLFADLDIDAIDRETLEMAAVEYARLRKNGLTIGDADLFIAEYCVQNDFTLVTNNTKHFAIVHNLKCTNWMVAD